MAYPPTSPQTRTIIWHPGHRFISEATLFLVSIIPLNGTRIYSSRVSPQFIADNWRPGKANTLKPHRKFLQSPREAQWKNCIVCYWTVRGFCLNEMCSLLPGTLPECFKWCNQLSWTYRKENNRGSSREYKARDTEHVCRPSSGRRPEKYRRIETRGDCIYLSHVDVVKNLNLSFWVERHYRKSGVSYWMLHKNLPPAFCALVQFLFSVIPLILWLIAMVKQGVIYYKHTMCPSKSTKHTDFYLYYLNHVLLTQHLKRKKCVKISLSCLYLAFPHRLLRLSARMKSLKACNSSWAVNFLSEVNFATSGNCYECFQHFL